MAVKMSAKERRKLMKKELIKRTKESLKRGQSGLYFKVPDGMNQFKPEKGDHFIDIIPYIVGNADPNLEEGSPAYYLEVWVHKPEELDGTPTRICNNRMYGKPCPRCEHLSVLKKEGADESIIEALVPKRRELYNVRDVTSESAMNKVQIFEVSYHFMGKKLADLIEGPVRPGSKNIEPTIDIASPDENGKTIGFKVSPKTVTLASGDTITFPDYTGHRLVDRDYVTEDDILMQAVALDEILIQSSYEEQYREYWGEDPTDAVDDPDDGPNEAPLPDGKKVPKKKTAKKRPPLKPLVTDDDDDDDVEPDDDVDDDVEPDDDVDDNGDDINLDEMDKDELIAFMKKKKYKIRGYKKMDEDELKYEIEECMDEEG